MFVQVIQGKVADAEALERQFWRWKEDVAPGAIGYLGSTFGITNDGQAIGIARFSSAEEAKQNSNRPEQTAWWTETEKCFASDVTFHDSTVIDQELDGGSDKAGFVQFMQGRIIDADKLRAAEKNMSTAMQTARPDFIGSIRCTYGDNEFTAAAYFTSEADARANEAKPMPPEAQAQFEEWQSSIQVDRWYDLSNPLLITA